MYRKLIINRGSPFNIKILKKGHNRERERESLYHTHLLKQQQKFFLF